MLASILGVALMLAAFTVHDVAIRRLFDCWRQAEPREWGRAVRPVRRAWPFSAFAWSHVYHWYEQRWFWSTPEWARPSTRARRLLAAIRWSSALFALGWFVILAPVVLRG